MITEDYVSYEIAKLLEEKGFDEPCIGFYNPRNGTRFEASIRKSWHYDKHGSINAPTHQMALKWLREVYKTSIVISVAADDNNLYSLWKFDIWNGNYSIIWGNKREKFNSYEQAVEAALKYTLENLI